MDEFRNEMEAAFLGSALTAFGQKIAIEFSEMISRYPPEMRPVAIGQIEAFAAATRATFSEEQIKVADFIRDASRIVTVIRDPKETENK